MADQRAARVVLGVGSGVGILIGLSMSAWEYPASVRFGLVALGLIGVCAAVLQGFDWARIGAGVPRVSGPLDVSVTDHLSASEFAVWVAELLARSGLQVRRLVDDSGVDRGAFAGRVGAPVVYVEARRVSGEPVLVCCRWRADGELLDAVDVQEHVAAAGRRTEVFIVTNRGFTPDAVAAAQVSGAVVLDREALGMWASHGRVPPEVAGSGGA